MFDLKAAAKAYLEAAKKPFSHNRSLTIGASEIGACARRIWYEKKLGPSGYDPDYKPSLGAATRGDIIEDNYTAEVVKYAVKTQLASAHTINGKKPELIWSGRLGQQTLICNEWYMSATPDGMIVNAPLDILQSEGISTILSPELVVEMKSFDPRILAGSLPKQQHVDQLNMQMGLIRKEGTYKPAFGVVVYVNASFIDDIRVFPVAYNHDQFTSQIRRSLYIMTADNADKVRPEGKIAGEKECAHCPFAGRCVGYVNRVGYKNKTTDELDKEHAKVIKNYVAAIADFQDRAAYASEMAEEYRAGLKEALAQYKIRAVDGALRDGTPFEIRWNKTAPRKTWKHVDVEKFLEEHGKNPDDFKRHGKETERLVVKLFPQPKKKHEQTPQPENEEVEE